MRFNPRSLAGTLDQVNEAFFWNRPIPPADRHRVAKWIASRHGQPDAYADTFALFDGERKTGYKLFTGELAQSASARHLAGQEACRALRLLGSSDRAAKSALATATKNLLRCLRRDEAVRRNPGTFCCGACTAGVWRHITVGGFDRREERLAGGMRALKSARNRVDGKWRRYPFWYTVSALVEMDLPQAHAELRYVAPSLERAAKREADGSVFALRRAELARRALNTC